MVLLKVVFIIIICCRWDINSKRNINYRSLTPIISLLSISHTRECQLWAAWALANLTLIDMEKYCALVEEEGGHEAVQSIMEEIIRESISSGKVGQCSVRGKLLELCQRVSNNLGEWRRLVEQERRLVASGAGLVMLEVSINQEPFLGLSNNASAKSSNFKYPLSINNML